MIDDAEADLEWSIRLHKAGVLDDAAAGYRKVLALVPDHAEASFLLATIDLQHGEAAAAAPLFAVAASGLEKPEEALAGLAEALDRMVPVLRRETATLIAGMDSLLRGPAPVARALRLAGEGSAALRLAGRAVKASPKDVDLLRLHAVTLVETGRLDDALAAFRRALENGPADAETMIPYSAVLARAGRADEALTLALRAVELSLDGDAGLREAALRQLTACHVELGRPADAVRLCRELAGRFPGLAEPWIALARLLRAIGRQEDAEVAVRQGLEHAGPDLELEWLHCFCALLPLYATSEQIAGRRVAYAGRLEALAARLEGAEEADLLRAERLIDDPTSFLLPYQYGDDDRRLQEIYGKLVSHVQGRRNSVRATGAASSDGRIRVIFVSAFVWRHTNWRMKRGWVKYLDRDRFHVSCLHVGEHVDEMTREIEGWCDAFHHLPEDLEGALRLLRDTTPDVIVYPEVGMSGLVLRLAALRLAPVQCCGTGHPVTTGLPTMDYFISGELVEPADGEHHYSETLVRLPGISFPYIPAPLPAADLTRADFGLPEEACLFLCLQAPQKYLPAFDDLYPRIAAAAPDAVFVFLAGGSGRYDMSILQGRLEAAFRAHGLDPARHVRFLPHLAPERYQALNVLGDVYLDTPGWSGGNTTLEAVQQNLPVVTLPGHLMRACFSAGILRQMGVEETIAADEADFVRIAARLATDPAWRGEVSARVRDTKSALETDMRSIAAMEDFLAEAVALVRKESAGESG